MAHNANVQLVNHGQVVGGAASFGTESNAGTGGTGVDFMAGGRIVNAGVIAGGAGGSTKYYDGGTGGNGIDLAGGRLENLGSVIGGAGGTATFGATLDGGAGGVGVDLSRPGTVANAGGIAGGAGGGLRENKYGAAGSGGADIDLSIGGTLGNEGKIAGGGGGSATRPFGDGFGGAGGAGVLGALTGSQTVAGNGTIRVGMEGSLSLLAGAASGQTVHFLGGSGCVELNNPLAFLGTIAGFGAHDMIVLQAPGGLAETGYKFAAGALTIVDGATTIATLHFNGQYTSGSFALTSDGHNGLLLTFA